jgi:ribonuclease HI
VLLLNVHAVGETGPKGGVQADDKEDLSHPEGQNTFPRMELEAVINAVRLTQKKRSL